MTIVESRGALLDPEYTIRFRSPLLNDENLRQGYLNNSLVLVTRVANGLKPLAFTDDIHREEAEAVLVYSHRAGLSILGDRWTNGARSHWLTSVAMRGVIGEVFDLDTLLSDYRELYAPWPAAVESVERELDKLRGREIADYLSFSKLEVNLPGIMDGLVHPAGEYARTGLLLGYPVASTVEVVGRSMQNWFNSSRPLRT